jgi:DNA polymerase III delta subunit
LNLDLDAIESLLQEYDNDTRAIREEALKMSWFMRGGLTYEDALTLSQQEREIVGSIIKKNMETTKESGLPFF